ncbi:MAG: hypothetical protein ACTHMM_08365, partial [Agriterribacter sp.]
MLLQLRKQVNPFSFCRSVCCKLLSLLLLLLFNVALAQSQTKVTGKVTNENGEGLPGATVRIKGTTTATQTEDDGGF